MKWSIFTYHVKVKDGVIIYNFFNKGVVFLENDIYKSLFNKNTSKKIINKLKKEEFIIENKVNEKENFLKTLTNEWENSKFLGLHILTTTGCNFKCPYCYQDGIQVNLLDEEKLKKALMFLEEYIKKNQIKECNLEITGGEPTTNWKIVETMLPQLNTIFKKYKIKYKTMIVTNGYLLTKEKVDLLYKYNWTRLQVTIDGLKATNDLRRIKKDGTGSFDEIIKNLDYIVFNKKIKKINLRINYDKSNINQIPLLLDYIKDRYGTQSIILSLGLITKTIKGADSNTFINKYGIIESEFYDNYIKLYKSALFKGFQMQDIFSFDGMCTSKLKHGFLLEPNGNIVKCVSGVGRKEFIIGNYIENKIANTNYLLENLYKECLEKECPFLPICYTGCRFDALVNKNSIEKINCKKKVLEKLNTELIKINYNGDDK